MLFLSPDIMSEVHIENWDVYTGELKLREKLSTRKRCQVAWATEENYVWVFFSLVLQGKCQSRFWYIFFKGFGSFQYLGKGISYESVYDFFIIFMVRMQSLHQ